MTYIYMYINLRYAAISSSFGPLRSMFVGGTCAV